MPTWGIWHRDALVFGTSPSSRKARNLRAEPACAVTTEDPLEPVVLEGRAVPVEGGPRFGAYSEGCQLKYEWIPTPGQDAVFAVRPDCVFRFLEDAAQFPRSATRWRFKSWWTPPLSGGCDAG